ncbi:hypothetical protein CSPAE12_10294, partial [Colletotrichum incanum]
FFSPQLFFALWLRSSVVSVLFSLISERCLLASILIIPIFDHRSLASAACRMPTSPCPWYFTASRRRKLWFSLLALTCPGW